MLIFIIMLATFGWICGVWLPWWCIGVVLSAMAVSAYFGAFDGGLESIPLVLGAAIFALFMVTVGFVAGDVTMVEIGSVIKLIFTGR